MSQSPNKSQHVARNKAVADALAGVVASLVSLWVFYPFEIWKLNVQASTAVVQRGDSTPATLIPLSGDGDGDDKQHLRRRLQASRHRLSLFAGIQTKSLHAASSSFCYFYIYSWITTVYRRRKSSKDIHTPVSASMHLLLSALAATLNTCITLPMDVISTRNQLLGGGGGIELLLSSSPRSRSCSDSCSSSSDAYIFYDASHSSQEEDDIDPRVSSLHVEDDDGEEEDEEEKKEDLLALSPPVGHVTTRLEALMQYPWLSLWKGLIPSLLLCANPAIHFTVYDVAKTRFLQGQNPQKRRLGMMEAFLLGLLAKFVATIATYPLIQAKVKLMTASSSSKRNLWTCILGEYERNGIKGLYRGCNLQLIHTLLKSALLMMLRERIERTTRRWLLTDKLSQS